MFRVKEKTMAPDRRRLIVGALAASVALLPGCATTGFGGGAQEALQRLLEISTGRAVERLVAGNGFLNDPAARLPVPPELSRGREGAVLGALLNARPVQQQLSLMVNQAAGEAADRAAPVIFDAIRRLTFADALGIVRGGPTSATDYLERSVGTGIVDAMLPGVGQVLRGFDGNGVLGPVLGAATGVNVVAIQRVVAVQAARSLFGAIGREEAAIRRDPRSARDGLVEALLGGRLG
ncbi:DUF4197 domain-containing protein [Sphingomonas sp. Leaf412]|uniref:DUF4197 domain-containing protein n=1 Tax=Sphingomonas sp. Leaf412 TaxID=1736370 RepID=UPI000ABD301C|nr:DUF4197 domain-containing protein [Sphingomonas sp. Leaf412]